MVEEEEGRRARKGSRRKKRIRERERVGKRAGKLEQEDSREREGGG